MRIFAFFLFLLLSLVLKSQSNTISIDFFQKENSCENDCSFCNAIENRDWVHVEKQIQSWIHNSNQNPTYYNEISNRLSKHKNVKFVLPAGEVLACLPTWMTLCIGFESQQKTYLFDLMLQHGKVYRLFCKSVIDENMLIMQDFKQVDSTYKIEAIKIGWISRFADSLAFKEGPPRIIPMDEYFIAYAGLEKKYPFYIFENLIYQNPRAALDSFERYQDVYAVCLMMCSYNIDTRYYALMALKKMNNPNCLPMLLKIAEEYKDYVQQGSEVATIYTIFCEETAKLLDGFCGTNISSNKNLKGNQMLKSGIEIWKNQIQYQSLQFEKIQN